MNFTPWKSVAALGAAAALAACGGGSDDAAPTAAFTPSTAETSAGASLPASAQQSVTALVAFAKQMIGQTSETAEPISLGESTLPTSEVDAPSPSN